MAISIQQGNMDLYSDSDSDMGPDVYSDTRYCYFLESIVDKGNTSSDREIRLASYHERSE